MSNKIFMAINSYKLIEGINPGKIEYLNRVLSEETKQRIERGNLHLHILAVILKSAMDEGKCDEEIDEIVNKKLNDRDLVIYLAQHLDDVVI